MTPPAPPAWFTNYLARGFHLVSYEQRKKGPEGSSALDWTSPDKRVTTPDGYLPDRNWGVFTGVEIAPGKFLVDVDFDWVEGLPLGNRLLPDTRFSFGRKSRVYSHAFYTVSTPLPRLVFTDIDGKSGFVELRGTKDDGTIGWQTMLPPSIHPSGEVVEIRNGGAIAHYETAVLVHAVRLYAIGCILYKYLGLRGLLHDQRLALSGFLLQEGIPEADVTLLCEAVAEATKNDVSDVRNTVRSTAIRIKGGERVKGSGSLAKAMGGDTGRDVIRAIRRYLGSQLFHEDSKGRIIADDQENIKVALDKLHVSVSYNAFSHRMLSMNGHDVPRLVDDEVLIPLRLDIDETFHFRPSKDFFIDVIKREAWKKPVHPVREYLDSLTWDGTPRVDEWLIKYALAPDTAYVRAVSAIVLLAAVRRIRQPGCKFDEMLILESAKQGTQKSSAIAALCPLFEWFSDDLPLGVDAKQVIERTAGKWIVEASELHGHRQREADHMKAFLSRAVDGPVRLAYDRTATEVARQFVIIGTTNTLIGYLKDFSGARRFWPVRIGVCNLEGITRARDQLWAEASAREQSGESIRLAVELWEDAEIEQDARRATHPWEDLLTESDDIDFTKDYVLATDVWKVIGKAANQRNNGDANTVREIMQRQGFTAHERRYMEVTETIATMSGTEDVTKQKQVWCWVKR